MKPPRLTRLEQLKFQIEDGPFRYIIPIKEIIAAWNRNDEIECLRNEVQRLHNECHKLRAEVASPANEGGGLCTTPSRNCSHSSSYHSSS